MSRLKLTSKHMLQGFPYIPLKSSRAGLHAAQDSADAAAQKAASSKAKPGAKKTKKAAATSKVGRRKAQTEGRALNNDPLTVKNWNNALFQDRFLMSFEPEGSLNEDRYTIVLDVIGKWHRLTKWTMLNRRGMHSSVCCCFLSLCCLVLSAHFSFSHAILVNSRLWYPVPYLALMHVCAACNLNTLFP